MLGHRTQWQVDAGIHVWDGIARLRHDRGASACMPTRVPAPTGATSRYPSASRTASSTSTTAMMTSRTCQTRGRPK